jgi:DNA-nicking Smr family endonuclease
MSRRDQPSPEEIAEFRAAVAGARPLRTAERVVHERPRPSPRPRQRELDEAAAIAESLRGSLEIDDLLAIGEADAFLRSGLQRSVLRDLRRGRWTIRNHLDLHGLNRCEAREEVTRFLAESVRESRRCVRIVHGRGHGSPGREGVLRQLVKSWLSRSQDVLAFCHPPPSDGGEGALWILLRSPRNR